MSDLVWARVPGWPYEATQDGQVRRVGAVEPMRPIVSVRGYHYVTVRDGPRRKWTGIHRLVAGAWLGEDKRPINHKNGQKTDNRVANLEYCSPSQNSKHAYATGLGPVGTKHWSAKLTPDDVRAIRASAKTQKALAHEYGVHRRAISKILKGQAWAHVI